MKAAIYARVSSKEQEREGYSIPAQIEACRKLAEKRRYDVVEEFIDVESAKQTGRTEFGKMIEYVKRARIDAIICHKVDRLCRNFRDFVTIDDLTASPIFVEEEFADNASGKLTYGLKVLLAKHYIDNLSDEVKKGMRQKILRGEWPHLAPYGYRNSGPKGTLEIEAAEAANLLYLFRTFATGDYSLAQLRSKLREDGLVYKDRKRIPAKGQLYNILTNPIYHGAMKIKGEVYPGAHEPIVTKELFDKVQEVFRAANRPKKTRRTFTYGGMITCALCGCAITAEIHKRKYVYYHCTGNRGGCDVEYIREEHLAPQFDGVVKGLQFEDRYYDLILRTLQRNHKNETEFRRRAEAQLRRRQDTLRKRIDQAYVDKLDGVISEELWLRKSADWNGEHSEVDQQCITLGKSGPAYLRQGTLIIELARNAYSSYLQHDRSENRRMLQIVASNYSLNGRNLHYSYKKPFDILVEGSGSANWSGSRDLNPGPLARSKLAKPPEGW